MALDKNHSVNFKIFSYFCCLSGVLLLCLSLFGIFYGSRSDHLAIFTGTTILSSEAMSLYKLQTKIAFSIVALYTLFHFMMWLGYFKIIRNRIFGILVLIIGIFSSTTDFCEHAMRVSLTEVIEQAGSLNTAFAYLWLVVRKISIGLIFLNVLLVATSTKNKLLIFYACLIPVMIFDLGKIWYLWLVTFHFASAGYFWNKRQDLKFESMVLADLEKEFLTK